MITAKELIAEIKELRQIKPDQNWVFSVKNRILGEQKERQSVLNILANLLFQPKVALAGVSTLAILFGILVLSQDSLPGDSLFALKRVVERGQTLFISQDNIAQNNLETANKRLGELTKIAKSNQVKKIAPALQEYQASLAEAAKNLIKAAATTSDPLIIKNIVLETQKLEENRAELERIYGIAGLDAKQGENPVQLVTDWLIKDLEKRTLTDEQELLFEEAKNDYAGENYNSALEKILKLSEL
ncbi:MAG: DUF5667 domain-containing protein [Candidatus Beckwithbacteria bacterium]